MFKAFCLTLSAAALLCAAALSAQNTPVIGGFVTQPGTPTDYFVNEVHVVCVPGTTASVLEGDGRNNILRLECPQRKLGESVTVYGKKSGKSGAITATRVETDLPSEMAVEGFAIVDRVLVPVQGMSGTIRADGYPLVIGNQTKITFAQSSALTLANIGTNLWVHYVGTLHTNGSVAASSLFFSPNEVGKREDKMRTKTEFDAASVDEGDRQGAMSRFFLGWDPKRLPAYKDGAMQDRIDRIGNKLVPAYQRALPPGDPTKIDFRFQLVDEKKIRDGITVPSGIILVPYQVVQALPDDSQLAAVLSADISEVMEKQGLRAVPAAQKMAAASIAGNVGSLFVPGLGIATSLANSKANSILRRHQDEQSSRTGLCWMHDAGYDLQQAPIAWWTLADKNRKGLASVQMPYRTQYLYRVLATAWADKSTKSPSSPPAVSGATEHAGR